MIVCLPSLWTWRPPNQSAQRLSRTPSMRISYRAGPPEPLTSARRLAREPAPGRSGAAAPATADAARWDGPGGAARASRKDLPVPCGHARRVVRHLSSTTSAYSVVAAAGPVVTRSSVRAAIPYASCRCRSASPGTLRTVPSLGRHPKVRMRVESSAAQRCRRARRGPAGRGHHVRGLPRLTAREPRARRDQRIASELLVTPGTVKKPLSHLLGKPGRAPTGLDPLARRPQKMPAAPSCRGRFHLAAHLRVTPTAAPAPTVP